MRRLERCPHVQGIERAIHRGLRSVGLWLLVVFGVLWGADAWASGPPSERWRTIDTPHFRVHYHEGVRNMAPDVARMCEAAHELLSPEFEYTPRMKTEVVLVDASEAANGSAGMFPRAVIRLFAVPPQSVDTRTDTSHWMWELILHEYAHVLHIDQIYGWIRVLNFPFGRQFLPNQILPRWFIEGTATAIESKYTSGGRVRSHFYNMYLRAALLEGTIPTLAQLSNQPPAFPYANFWYLVGSEFVDYIGETRGWDALFEAYRQQARRLRPWAINYMALTAIGETFDDLYQEFIEVKFEEAYRLDQKVIGAGVVEGERVTNAGYQTQWVAATPQGSEPHWLRADGKDEVALVDASDPESRKRRVRSNGSFSIFPNGQDAVISRTTRYADGYMRNDLWLVDLTTGRLERLTRGLRASQPSVSPSGGRIAYVRPADGRFDLYIYEMSTGTARRLVRSDDWTTISQPSWTPDGRYVLYGKSAIGGGRNLYAVELETGRSYALTDDRSINDSPRVSPDGRWLYYHSDRDGIFNIYVRDLEAAHSCRPGRCDDVSTASTHDRRVTRVRTGALVPVVVRENSGCVLWMSTYSARGFDIAKLPLRADCSPAQRLGAAPEAYDRPTMPIGELEDDGVIGEPRRYRTGLLSQPWTWSPIYHELGVHRQFGLSTGGGDPAGRFAWRADLSIGDPFNQLRWAVDLQFNMTTPAFYVYSARSVSRRNLYADSRYLPYDLVSTTFGGGSSYSFGGVRATQRLSASYNFERRDYWDEPSYQHDPGGMMPRIPTMGNFSNVYVGWSISNLRSYVRSVSVERGWSAALGLRFRSALVGSDVETRELSFSLMKALPVHRWERHAFVLRMQGATNAARPEFRSAYSVGGLHEQNLWEALREQIGASTRNVRGYRPGAIRGAHYVMMSAEYRFPLLWLDWGHSTLPLFFERIHGAVFVDAATAFDIHPTLAQSLMGVGAEIRLDVQAGYYLPQGFRLGVARGIGQHGIWQGYFLFGGSF